MGTIGQNRLADINPEDIDHIEVLNGAAAAAIYGSRANAGVVQIFTKKGITGAPVVSFSSSIIMNQLRKKIPVNQSPTKFGGPTDGPGALTQDIITAVNAHCLPIQHRLHVMTTRIIFFIQELAPTTMFLCSGGTIKRNTMYPVHTIITRE